MEDIIQLQQQRLLVFGLIVFFAVGAWLGLGLCLLVMKWRRRPVPRGLLLLFTGLLLAGLAASVDAFVLEPDWLQVTRVEVRTDGLPEGRSLRVVHLSDLHVDGWTRGLERLPDEVNALRPDLLVFTGDSLNAPEGLPVLREVLSRIQTRYGRYAVQGNHDVARWGAMDLFGGGVAEELRGEARVSAEGRVVLCGAPYGQPERIKDCLRTTQAGGLRLVAYHTPDLVEELSVMGPDLYLAGHTHGGQVRMPIYGAILTLSRYDKKYEMGLYQVERTALFVSRGIGVEPHVPRIRFLCRPEIAVIDLVGTSPR